MSVTTLPLTQDRPWLPSSSPSMNELAQEIWQTADEHGFHEPLDASVLKLGYETFHEVGEWLVAFEAYRKGQPVDISALYLLLSADDEQRELMVRLILIMTEAFEIYQAAILEPEKEAEEVADAIIRLFHYARTRGINIDQAVRDKMEINKARPYKHGKKF
jgi:NTP pyrophosphatase (non-canonical NTP hydrolase)